MTFGTAADSGFEIDLAGLWQVAEAGSNDATEMPVPGDVHSALFAAGRIPDPYFGRNEYDLRHLAEKDWIIERKFEMPEGEFRGSWYLDIDYVDTVATIRVNGIVVAETANCFRRYRPDVSNALKVGENTISVQIHSSIKEGARLQALQPFKVPHLEHNSPIPNGNLLRKPQCHFGWDWNIAIAPLGLYGTVAIKRMASARIEHVLAQQTHHDDGSAELKVTVSLYADAPGVLPLHIGLGDDLERLDCAVNEGATEIVHVIHVEKPDLWWPIGSGEQALYELVVETPSETITKQIGFRQLELITDADEAGSRFAFRLNGREIFCRGANWIPADALFSRTSREKTEALLQAAVDANMNMIRIWGGGFYEADWFYDLCDRMGLMVWQDFMFACYIFPSTPEFLAEVDAEVDYQVKRLSSHPSIVLWCGDNELIGALNWFEETRANRDRYLVSYDRLNRTIEVAMKAANPDLIWWPSSPASGHLNFGDAWHDDGSGDMHYWSVWHENKDFSDYRNVTPRFCSEFGFQSYTSMPVIRDFARPSDMNIASPVMESHQKNVGGNERIAATMFRYFRFPKNFESFVYLSQVQQGLAIRTAVDFWRSLKPHCMGTVYWQLNDTWPVASWASLDYGGSWKAMHYMAQRFFQPVNVAAIPSKDSTMLELTMVNDTADSVEIEVETWSVDLKGRRTALETFKGQCSADRAEVIGQIDTQILPADTLLFWRFSASDGSKGEGHHVLETYKALELQPSGLELKSAPVADTFEVELRAAGLALHVMVEADCAGTWSDNFFDLTAGESRKLVFKPSEPVQSAPKFKVNDLHDCYFQHE